MSDAFGAAHAAAYDALYRGKDYEAECDVVERIFRERGEGQTRRLLDLGCGTGGHAIPLARRGYEVVAIDRSSAMLAVARRKTVAAAVAGRVTLIEADAATVRLDRPVDAALMMFAVLGYQASPGKALAAVRAGLRPNGLFVFDVWYGPAVEAQRPSPQWRLADVDGHRIIRLASGELDRSARTCAVDIRLLRLAGDRIVDETSERHRVRYFFEDELRALLRDAGLEMIRLAAFPDPDRDPSPFVWNALGVARATP